MNKVAILYIATGNYYFFFKRFYESFEEKFLLSSEKHYFIFTDADDLGIEEDSPRIHKIYQAQLGWPKDTLYRFKMFLSIEEELKKFDYIFFMNSNLICLEEITEYEFLPTKEELLVVRHPGFYNKEKNHILPYERRRSSKAYIPFLSLKKTAYYMGGLNGGKSKYYLSLIHTLNNWINEDEKKGITALWHDESHLNKYIYTYKGPIKVLSPSYGYPEDQDLPFKVKILILEKYKYIKLVNKKKENYQLSLIQKIYLKVRQFF